eukprot:bmy_07187T0
MGEDNVTMSEGMGEDNATMSEGMGEDDVTMSEGMGEDSVTMSEGMGEDNSDEVLTVIKAKAQWPAWQPLNVRAAPSAEFSVDRTRHLMSFLTMMGPSPDWNVGLSAEDLCTKECGWVQKVSPNKPTIPQEKIRPLTSLDHPQNDTPETCIYSNWSPWSACSSSTCDKGKRMRQRMLKAQLDLSVPCPDTQDFQPCTGPGCSDEDGSTCTMSEWITWSPCSISCGTGMRSRERYVKQFPEDGSVCTLPTEETEKCTVNEECSPSSCLMTEWGEWDECSATCGMGMKKRHRMVKMSPADGSMCKAETSQAEKCMMPECHTIPCLLSPWSEWSDCSVTCGKGMRTRQRMLKSLAELGDCNEELEQVEKCMLPECPIDCELTEWSQWSECNKSCGKGHMIRTRMIQMEPQFGGAPCPETVQRKKCRIRKCLRNPSIQKLRWREARESRRSCRMRPWTAWSECTKLCGGGIQERYMTVKKRFKSSQFTSCKDKKEIRACHVHPSSPHPARVVSATCTEWKRVPLEHPPGWQERDPGLLHMERQLSADDSVPGAGAQHGGDSARQRKEMMAALFEHKLCKHFVKSVRSPPSHSFNRNKYYLSLKSVSEAKKDDKSREKGMLQNQAWPFKLIQCSEGWVFLTIVSISIRVSKRYAFCTLILEGPPLPFLSFLENHGRQDIALFGAINFHNRQFILFFILPKAGRMN